MSTAFSILCVKRREEYESAGRVWQEQTDHKLVRHLAGDAARYQSVVRLIWTPRKAMVCVLRAVDEEVDELVDV